MTNLHDTVTPTIALFGKRFAPWQMRCSVSDDSSDEDSSVQQADEDDGSGFEAEDPRDIRVLERLARLEAFSAA